MPRARPTPHPPAPDAAPRSRTIGFRLEGANLRRLMAAAEAQGLSRNELARRYVLERLANPEDSPAPSAALDELHAHLERTRLDLALGFEAVLVSAGKVTKEDAHTWAERNFRER